MRRLLSILLLALIGLPVASPLFALGANQDSGLPACCRRAGVHHCMSAHAILRGSSESPAPALSAPCAKCPYAPAMTSGVHPSISMPSVADSIFAALVSHPAGTEQTRSKLRISAIRSRQKRGPPSFSFL